MTNDAAMVRLPESGRFPTVKLVDPTAHGYLLIAFEIDHRPPVGFMFESSAKQGAIGALKGLAGSLRQSADVIDASVFKAVARPPGRGAL